MEAGPCNFRKFEIDVQKLCFPYCFLKVHSVQSVINNITQLSGRGFPCIFILNYLCRNFTYLSCFKMETEQRKYDNLKIWILKCWHFNFDHVKYCIVCLPCIYIYICVCWCLICLILKLCCLHVLNVETLGFNCFFLFLHVYLYFWLPMV